MTTTVETKGTKDANDCAGHVGGLPAIAAAAEALVSQSLRAVEALSDEQYTAPSGQFHGSTIGQHLRHALDHFNKLVEGHARGDVVAYDRRDRGVPVESDRAVAAEAIRRLRDTLCGYDAVTLAGTVTIRVMVDGDGTEVETGSTLGRELAFVTHHAIHHHAMIQAISREHGLELEEGFGRAPSTKNHDQTCRH